MNKPLSLTLYDQDYYLWIQKTIEQLRGHEFFALDLENLIEELESMGRSEKRALKSLLTRLLEHLLKLAYWESEREYNQRKWRSEIVTFRTAIQDYLEDSPSLKPYLESIYPQCLTSATKAMSELFILPKQIEISLTNSLNETWFPD